MDSMGVTEGRSRTIGVGVVVVLALGLWGAPGAEAQSGCRSGNPLANVRDPGRLTVRSRCVTARGVVSGTSKQHDGDIDVLLKADPKSAYLVDHGDRKGFGGNLLLEIVPADQAGCRKGQKVRYGVCTGAGLRAPRKGSHITVTGPWVSDHGHEGPTHNEIHPVWTIAYR
jgi:hypothetical protein